MINKFLLSVLLIFASAQFLSAQSAQTSAPNEKLDGFIIKSKFPLKVNNIYSFKDSSEVTRVYSNNQTRKFTRVYTYYFTAQAINPASNGFQEINIIIDSMNYSFKENGETIEYRSQIDTAPRQDFKDLTLRMAPMNREFKLTYSPYNEVVNIESQQFEQLKEYLDKNRTSLMGEDTLIYHLWQTSMTMPFLSNFSDIHKGIIPDKRIFKDSIYQSKISLSLNDVNYKGDLKIKLTENFANVYTLQAETDTLKLIVSAPLYLYGFKMLVQPFEGKALGVYEIKITNRGTIKEAKAEFNSEMKAIYDEFSFKETTKTFYHWLLLGQFNY